MSTFQVYRRLINESPDILIILGILMCIPQGRPVALILLLFLIYFHRSPDLSGAIGKNNTLQNYLTSPCYGTVMSVNAKSRTVSIFLGITDIHLQYFPYHGTIKSKTKNAGAYFPANISESDNNTNVTTVLATKFGDITIKQISGVLARKIISEKEVGETVKRGDRLGFIRFGSRVDITFPKGTRIMVWPEDQLLGTHSIIGHFDGK